ncbi:hypothetical protein MLD52_15565 [Puniceicoccaceae bacterium K14]|nr:hypothetical protein [Puniceicoccaceae bacterium K14]
MKYLGIDLSDANVSLALWDRAAASQFEVRTQPPLRPIVTAVKKNSPITGKSAFELIASKPKSVCLQILSGKPNESVEEGDEVKGSKADQLAIFLQMLFKQEKILLQDFKSVGVVVDDWLDPVWLPVISDILERAGVDESVFFSRQALAATIHLQHTGENEKDVCSLDTGFMGAVSRRFKADGEKVGPVDDAEVITWNLVAEYSGLLKNVLAAIRKHFRLDLRRADPDAVIGLLDDLSLALLDSLGSFNVRKFVADSDSELIQLKTLLLESALGNQLMKMQSFTKDDSDEFVVTGLSGAVALTVNLGGNEPSFVSGADLARNASVAASWIVDQKLGCSDRLETIPFAALRPRAQKNSIMPEPLVEPEALVNTAKVQGNPRSFGEVFTSESKWVCPEAASKVLFQGWLFDFSTSSFRVRSGSDAVVGELVIGSEFVDYEGELLSFSYQNGKSYLEPLTNRLRFLRNLKRVNTKVEVFVGDIVEIENTRVLFMLTQDTFLNR